MFRHGVIVSVSAALFCTTVQAGVLNSASQLVYDENGKLDKHTLLYPIGKCADLIEKEIDTTVYGFDFFAVTDDAQADFFRDFAPVDPQKDVKSLDDCQAVCLERGVDQKVVTTPMPFRKYHGVHDKENIDGLEDWFQRKCRRVEVGFMNYHNRNAPLNVYWVNEGENNKEVLLLSLNYGERNTKCFESVIGHLIIFEDDQTKEIVHKHRVEFVTIYGIGDSPPHPKKNPDHVIKQIQSTLNTEWTKMTNVKRSFTPIGFKKGHLPDDLWASIGAFYYNNRDYKQREEWDNKGLFVNWWETDVYFIQIPWALKTSWQDRLKDLVEVWVGEPLEQTDMYGLRQYEEGARLLTHVDRETTHAASLIVNVAQGNLSEPWPIEVHDHAGRLHQVTMSPGEIVYYESASALHGRNTPLTGDGAYYVNLFTHYRPTGDPRWQYKENRPDQLPPLMDVGECHLEGTLDMIGKGAVKCDNSDIGPYLSPHLITAKSGKDLFDWWVKVSPQEIKDQVVATLPGYDTSRDEL